MPIGKQLGGQRRKVQLARSRRLCHRLAEHVVIGTTTATLLIEHILQIFGAFKQALRTKKCLVHIHYYSPTRQTPGHRCATTSVWEWFASARAGSVRLPETSEVRFSAYASHRGTRCFDVEGHDAGGDGHSVLMS